ncbi:MAG TPA: SHOCT domain-containing protein [Acidimicrobiales bacterium]|nr:SHOCT domain-containing protein [Acidimicrobiales bacterium]
MTLATFGVGQVVYSILWFFLFIIEIWLMISIFIDIFRSHDLRGWAKAAWVVLVLVLPIVGIIAYLVMRGDEMRAHQLQAREQLFPTEAQGPRRSVVEELSQLAALRREGVISEDEFQHLKARVMGRTSGAGTDGDDADRTSSEGGDLR